MGFDNNELLESPYHQARQEWDLRLGTVRTENYTLKKIIFGSALLLIFCLTIIIVQAMKAEVVPYIVEVGDKGVIKVGEVSRNESFSPSEGMYRLVVEQFIRNTRTVSLDLAANKRAWLEAYRYADEKVAITMEKIALELKPFDNSIEARTVLLDLIKKEDGQYRIEWKEKIWSEAKVKKTIAYTGFMKLKLTKPKDLQSINSNPIGIFVEQFEYDISYVRTKELEEKND